MKGYTRKVGLRKPKPRVAIGLLQVLSDEQAAQVREHGHLTGYERAEYEGTWAVDWLRDQVRRSAATLDGLPPEMRETLAHRTRVRRLPVVPREPATMPLDGCWVCYDWSNPCDDCAGGS